MKARRSLGGLPRNLVNFSRFRGPRSHLFRILGDTIACLTYVKAKRDHTNVAYRFSKTLHYADHMVVLTVTSRSACTHSGHSANLNLPKHGGFQNGPVSSWVPSLQDSGCIGSFPGTLSLLGLCEPVPDDVLAPASRSFHGWVEAWFTVSSWWAAPDALGFPLEPSGLRWALGGDPSSALRAPPELPWPPGQKSDFSGSWV